MKRTILLLATFLTLSAVSFAQTYHEDDKEGLRMFLRQPSAIIVHPGGKLVIDGATLSNVNNGGIWQVITVLGDPNQPINNTYQGSVELKNGSKIENAHCGILAKDGGMVSATCKKVQKNKKKY